jgi:DNA-directed RNA polymerase subunit RPC12/RpoP
MTDADSEAPPLVVLLRAIDVGWARQMHLGQKLGENARRILGLRCYARATRPRVVFLFLSTRGSEHKEQKGALARAFCLAEIGPVLQHSSIADPAMQLGHYSRLVVPQYAPFLHLFKRSRSVLGAVPDEILRPSLYKLEGYGNQGDYEVPFTDPLHACVQQLLEEEGVWREHDLDPRLNRFCEQTEYLHSVCTLDPFYPADLYSIIAFKQHVTAHKHKDKWAAFTGKGGHRHINTELMYVGPVDTPAKQKSLVCLYCSDFFKKVYGKHTAHRHVIDCPACGAKLFRKSIADTPYKQMLMTCNCHGNPVLDNLRAEVACSAAKLALAESKLADMHTKLRRANERSRVREVEDDGATVGLAGLSEAALQVCRDAAAQCAEMQNEDVANRTRSRKRKAT